MVSLATDESTVWAEFQKSVKKATQLRNALTFDVLEALTGICRGAAAG